MVLYTLFQGSHVSPHFHFDILCTGHNSIDDPFPKFFLKDFQISIELQPSSIVFFFLKKTLN